MQTLILRPLRRSYVHTIVIEASVRLINFGRTSPSSPATSSSAASHRDKTVPTSCAKHSIQFLSAFGRPSNLISLKPHDGIGKMQDGNW